MVAKEEAKHVIDGLPDTAGMGDVIEALAVVAKIQHAEQEIAEGKGVPHGEAMQHLTRSGKQTVQEVLDASPDDVTFDDILYELYALAKFRRGLQEVRDGHGIPHEEVIKRFSKWLR